MVGFDVRICFIGTLCWASLLVIGDVWAQDRTSSMEWTFLTYCCFTVCLWKGAFTIYST